MIGIITFHGANNYGAVLQASALQEYISKKLGECEIINYFPNNNIPGSHQRLRHIAHVVKTIIKSKDWIADLSRESRFNTYRTKYIRATMRCYYGDSDIFANPPEYDVLISGSDQILNITLTGESEAYYLGFDERAKKISYASSFGRDEVTEKEERLIANELDRFDHISVREKSGKKIIERYTHHETQLVVDPVFLLDKSDWDLRCTEIQKRNYILVYSMENSEILEAVVKKLKRIYGLPVYVIRGGGSSGRIDGVEVLSCGPSEFLGYIRNSEYIITNSFHGTAFGYIFGKKILSVAHSKRNTRLESLLSLTNVYSKQYKSLEETASVQDHIIDGEIALSRLAPIIADSKLYLKNALSNN